MRHLRYSAAVFIGLWALPASAQCVAPLSEIQAAFNAATTKLESVATATEASRSKVISTYAAVDAAIGRVTAARATQNESQLDQAIKDLGVAKAAYDAAVKAERPFLIARLETEREMRGRRQALNDAALYYRLQGEALVNAAERAKRGEVVPSLSDLLVCEQETCGRISPIEHAAMIAIGAVADTVDAKPWPLEGRACDFTLFDSAAAHTSLSRTLLTAQKEAQQNAQKIESALVAARQTMAGAIPGWDTSIAGVLDAHNSPATNSHADEILGMAIEELRKQDAAFDKVAAAYRTADESAVAARKTVADTTARTQSHLTYWADIGRATINAAVFAERNASPTDDLEHAAFAVMGAPQPQLKKCLVVKSKTPKGAWVFAPTPSC